MADFDFTKHIKDWPAYLHVKLKSDWVLSGACRENCECYFLRHWEVSHYLEQLNPDHDSLTYNGIGYVVIQQSKLDLGGQCALSFRKPLAELNLPAYVLVKGIENKS